VLLRAVLIVENGDSPFARIALRTAVKNYGFFQRSDQLVSVRRHGNSNWPVLSVVEMSVCNIDERLKISQESRVSSLRERPKVFPSFDLCRKIDVRNPLAASWYVLTKHLQTLVDLPKFSADIENREQIQSHD
jgi:hypothetical protein